MLAGVLPAFKHFNIMIGHPLVSHLRSLGCALFAALSLVPASASAGQTEPYLFESDAAGPPSKILWQTEPGVRYDLWQSDNLADWSRVTGYPAQAAGLAMEHAFTPGPKGFFKIVPIDDQPPVVVAQYPAVDGFAVGRFADLSIELADATGIDPASIRLTVGAVGPLAQGAAGLTISGNTLTYDSGDAALGAWGETVTATLVAADALGHALTHTWSFRMEPEPQTAANIFVFGSPTAQRAGQQVSGPAAALAARYPAPVGPQKANDPPPWSIESVLADRIVIAYEAGGMPTFTAGQLICNLAPRKESEIFYRWVVSTSDDPALSKLTIMTTDAALTDFATSGSAALSANSLVYELDATGTLTSAVAVTDTLTFPRTGYDLSGSEFKLRDDGYEVKVNGVSYSSGGGLTLLDITATDYSWWFTPRIRAGFEIGFSGLKSFEAIASGQVSCASVFDGDVLLAGVSVERTIYDLPEAAEPKTVIYMGNIGPVPVFATLGFDFSLKSKAEAKALLEFNLTYRQEASASFGINYERGTGVNWTRSFQASSPDLRGSAALTGEFSYELTLDPRLEFLVYGLAGIKAALEPSAGVVATASTSGGFDGKIEASLDFVLGLAGPAFDLLNIDKELSYNIWEGEWPLTPQNLAFKTQPQSRTVAPGGDVSFTCTVDSPTPPTFQWYQNGRKIAGQTSRSLFLQQVNTGHAGTYKVKATAGNLSADSDLATLTVLNGTPANLDTDGDGIPDIYETNTGVWVSATDRGTNPYKWDSDDDGLSDGVETNTGVNLSRSNTGTHPNKADTDGDGINDKREIDLGSNPNIGPAPEGFALISAGWFQMGDALDGYEVPVHSVYVSGFYMGKYEVTKALWDEVRTWGLDHEYTDLRAGGGKAANHPVQTISWYDVVKWCNARSEKEGLTPCYRVAGAVYRTTENDAVVCNWSASGYRLPSEAEWEKAARGGLSGKRFPWGDTINHTYANYYNSNYSYESPQNQGYHPTYAVNGSPYTSPVGSFSANGYGLYDMAGNVWEWCWDLYDVYTDASQVDPRGPATGLYGSYRVFRGGCWDGTAARTARAAPTAAATGPYYAYNGTLGFRLARGQP